jgi:hypothetical protein
MWILSFLPDSAIHIMFVAGILGVIAGFVLGVIPIIGRYQLPIQVVSIVVLTFAVFLEGGMADNNAWLDKVHEQEAKVAQSQVESAKTNTKIVTRIVTKNQVIKQAGDTVVQYIDREVKVFDNECKIPGAAITSHDAAAQGKTIEQALKPDSVVSTDQHDQLTKPPEKKSWRDYLPK